MPLPTPYPVVGGTIIASAWGTSVVNGLPQIGYMAMWVGDAAPPDYLLCRGQAVSRTAYLALWTLCQTATGVGRFGNGDGSTTFNLPDLCGRYPFGHNVGPSRPGNLQAGTYGQAGVGQVFGNKDAIGVPNHNHVVPNHIHPVNINTGGESSPHYHSEQLGEVLRRNPFTPTINIRFGDGFTFPADSLDTGSPSVSTGWNLQGHGHNVSGNTAGSGDFPTTVVGNDVTNTNLPPSQSVNFIVRAL